MTRARLSPRPGFTLVELLVAIGLILVLLGLVLAVDSSGITDSYKTVGAADRVSGWLIIAKSNAQRTKRPAGVRFLVGANNQLREAQYIEVPDPYTPLPATAATPVVLPRLLCMNTSGSGARRVFITDTNTADLTTSVFPGDMLSIPEFNTLHTVVGFGPPFGPPPATPPPASLPPGSVEVFIRIPSLLPNVPQGTEPTYATTGFGFHRLPQPAIGEPTLQLTGDMVVDGQICQPAMGGPTGTSFDLLFAPSGEVINASSGRTVFWVRDVRLPFVITGTRQQYEEAGQMALIVVYSKTGAIATQPVLMPPNPDPYAATRDAVNTGL